MVCPKNKHINHQSPLLLSLFLNKPIMTNNRGIPSKCWCGNGITTFVSKTEENPYRRFFRCEIGLQVTLISNINFFCSRSQLNFFSIQRKKEQHLFKWVDEALCDEIQLMREQQSRMAEEIEDLRGSFKNTVQEEVMNNKNSGDVGCVGTILSFLCLCSKFD